jgi:hypothetical protein
VTSGSPTHRESTGPEERSRRRVRRGPYSPTVDPLEPSGDDALPTETSPVPWEPGRGPITTEEALGSLRRRRRAEHARSGKGEDELPPELPAKDAPKLAMVTRQPPYHLAFAHARAEAEGTNLTAVIEEFLITYSRGRPQDPETVRDRQFSLFRRSYQV